MVSAATIVRTLENSMMRFYAALFALTAIFGASPSKAVDITLLPEFDKFRMRHFDTIAAYGGWDFEIVGRRDSGDALYRAYNDLAGEEEVGMISLTDQTPVLSRMSFIVRGKIMMAYRQERHDDGSLVEIVRYDPPVPFTIDWEQCDVGEEGCRLYASVTERLVPDHMAELGPVGMRTFLLERKITLADNTTITLEGQVFASMTDNDGSPEQLFVSWWFSGEEGRGDSSITYTIVSDTALRVSLNSSDSMP